MGVETVEKLLRVLERRFGRYAIPNIAALLLAPKAAFFLWSMTNPGAADPVIAQLRLVPAKVLEGEVWRLFTFIAEPPFSGDSMIDIIFFFFYGYILFLFCGGLQARWGAFRLNVYLLFGWAAIVSGSFVASLLHPPYGQAGGFLQVEATLLLAFATYYPNFVFRLFLILPVKVKYLAWLAVGAAVLSFIEGPWDILGGYAHRVVLLGIYGNYLLFFGPGLVKSVAERQSSASRRRKFEDAMRRGHEQREADERREREEAEREDSER